MCIYRATIYRLNIKSLKLISISNRNDKLYLIFNCIIRRIFTQILNFAYGIVIIEVVGNIIPDNFPSGSDCNVAYCAFFNILVPCNKCVASSGRFCKSNRIFNSIFAWIFLVVYSFAYGISIDKVIGDTIFDNFPIGSNYLCAYCATSYRLNIKSLKLISISNGIDKHYRIFNRIIRRIFTQILNFAYGIVIIKIVSNIILDNFPNRSDGL